MALYNKPNEVVLTRHPELAGFNPDDHIRPMMQEWWGSNLARVKARESKDPRGAYYPIRDVLMGFIIQGKSEPLAYRDLNTFLEVTPVNELGLDVLHSIVKVITPVADHLDSFEAFLSAIREVLVGRRGFDEDTFNTMFIPAENSSNEVPPTSVE